VEDVIMANNPRRPQTREPTTEGDPWLVLKFGGTSVSSRDRWETIAETVRERLDQGYRLVLVCSALSQVSNRLEALLEKARQGDDLESGIEELWRVHTRLAADLGVELDGRAQKVFDRLREILEGIRLTREVTPRLQARVMSSGELLSTILGVRWLESRGIAASWQDARDLLAAEEDPYRTASPERQYLWATCPHQLDPELRARLDGLEQRVVITQGFIARLDNGDTVLLGRGGSDTAAAYFATKLGAEQLEIWTDVPGMFTANPHNVPTARLLRRLGYAEAGELASKGAKVLHPRAIRPVAAYDIPIHIRCTPVPQLEGTVIARSVPGTAQVKAVSERDELVLVSMNVDGDWQGIGVIADITACFKERGLSIDLLASSQTNVAVALDPRANRLDEETLEPLLEDLGELSDPELIEPTASVSLVGTGIRAILHEWAATLELFEDENVYMVSQSANDLSLSLIVNESSAADLVQQIHDRLFGDVSPEGPFGPTWEELVDREEALAA
jgi:diaminopimelate decarboxylase/aspartate kinase